MSDRSKHLEFLRKTAKDALWSGDYERALTLYDDGLALARSWKNRELEDLFTCNRVTTLVDMGRTDFDLTKLKEIVLRNPQAYNGALAAYVVANAHDLRKETPRAISYAQIALQRSREQQISELIAGSLWLLANLELRESRFSEARELLGEALDRLNDKQSREWAIIADNLGYCEIALERLELGVPLIERSLSLLQSLGARQAMDYPSLDLCFADLKRDRLDSAEDWGVRALALGKEFGREDVIKNSHYLLAETYSQMGRESHADEHYEALAGFYPDFPALKNYLRQISLMEVINLRA
jgi:tetratricopeptide (TPR) repeat protein